MATSTTLTFGDLIEETLDHLLKATERPARIAVGTNSLANGGDTTLTLATVNPATANPAVNVGDILEFSQELMRVVSKSDDSDPIYTVERQFLGSPTAGQVVIGTAGRKNPQFPRFRVARALRQGLSTFDLWLPKLTTDVVNREPSAQYAELPATCVEVYRVQTVNETTFKFMDTGGWEFVEDLPVSISSTTKVLKLPSWVTDTTDLLVTYQTAYAFSDSTEAGTISVPLGSGDLLPLYAAGRMALGRELSRNELDKVEEWNHEAAARQGVNLRMVREVWSDFYRRLDEVRRLQSVPRHRPYRKMPTLRSN